MTDRIIVQVDNSQVDVLPQVVKVVVQASQIINTGGSSSGTVTSVDVSGSDGIVSTGGPVTAAGTIALSLGNITPDSVAAVGTVTGSNLSGTNTGDQDLSGYAQTADLGSAAFTDSTDYATAAQGATADSAVQPGDLATVATTGDYNDLINTPTLPTGTVTSVSVTTANGVSGSVATATTTPAISLVLGNITPTSVAATGSITGSNLSGTNTGDQDLSGYALTSSLATVATTGSYNDLDDLPTLTSGTVTSVVTGTGLTGGPITSTGTVSLSTGTQASLALADSSTQPGDNISTLTNDAGYTSNAGTVTSVSVTTANGVSGSVATSTTTPAITLTLGAITPSSVASSGTVTGSNLSGTNTGDQTSVTGNAGTATALQTGRTINGITFDGTANINLVPRVQTVTYSSTPTVNWSNIEVSRITLTGNATITNTGAVDGQKMILELTQGGSGSYTLSFDSSARFGSDITSVTLSTTVGKMDRVGLIYNSAAGKYDVVSYVRGF